MCTFQPDPTQFFPFSTYSIAFDKVARSLVIIQSESGNITYYPLRDGFEANIQSGGLMMGTIQNWNECEVSGQFQVLGLTFPTGSSHIRLTPTGAVGIGDIRDYRVGQQGTGIFRINLTSCAVRVILTDANALIFKVACLDGGCNCVSIRL